MNTDTDDLREWTEPAPAGECDEPRYVGGDVDELDADRLMKLLSAMFPSARYLETLGMKLRGAT